MQPANGKDTIYIDVDDEITAIIDKVASSKQKVVVLVLPKRAGVLQSIVNMKLLKRSGDNSNKNLVLVTSETALMPLAGAAGLYVAKTPTSKPEIPVSPSIHDGTVPGETDVLDLDDPSESEYTAENAGTKSVGELAGGAAAVGLAPNAIETVELDDAPTAADAAKPVAAKKAKTPKDAKIPNFSRFQKRLAIAAGLLVLLLIGLYFCIFVLPKATIAISTDATDYNSSLAATLDTGASNISLSKKTIPATTTQQKKTYTQQVAATGQQNNGQKAKGTININAGSCSADIPNDVPAGSVVTSGSMAYLTQNSTTFVPTASHGKCSYQAADSTDIAAQKAGASYNATSGSDFSINGRSDLSATGSATGGTDDIVKVVSQSDIDSAKGKISTENSSSIKTALASQLRSNNLYPLLATFSSGSPAITTSSNAGDAADTVTVTEVVNYTMYGAQRSYLDQLIKNDIKQQIDPATQTIINDGLDKASLKLTGTTDTTARISLQTTATVGPKLSVAVLTQQVRGKKVGYVKSLIGNQPGVTDVSVKLSPFWVGSVPKSDKKITITVGKATQSNDGSGQN